MRHIFVRPQRRSRKLSISLILFSRYCPRHFVLNTQVTTWTGTHVIASECVIFFLAFFTVLENYTIDLFSPRMPCRHHVIPPFYSLIWVLRVFCVCQVGGVVETNRPDSKNAQYQACIKQGDLLLNRVQKLGRVVDA